MSILLALLAQSATLPADHKIASLTCASAVQGAAAPGDDLVRLAAHAAYFVMQAAAVEGEDATFLTRLGGIQGGLEGAPPFEPGEAEALLGECDARFPLARASGPIELPTEPLRRDILCVAALGVVVGAARGAQELGQGEVSWLAPTFEAYLARLRTVHAGDDRASTDDEQKEVAGGELRASLALGNVERIGVACHAALG